MVRLLCAGPLALDRHTPGLPGLDRRRLAVWSEARYAAADRVFAAAAEADALLLAGPVLTENSAALRGVAFLRDRIAALGKPVVWSAGGEDELARWPTFARPANVRQADATILGLTAAADGEGFRVRGRGVDFATGPLTPPQSAGEPGPHGATMLTVDGGEVAAEDVPTDAVRFHEFLIEATDGSRSDQIEATMRRHLAATADGPAALNVARWTVRGHGEAWRRLLQPGPRADLLASLRADAPPAAWAESVAAEPDDAQAARWRDGSTAAGRFGLAVEAAADCPVEHPAAAAAAGLALIT